MLLSELKVSLRSLVQNAGDIPPEEVTKALQEAMDQAKAAAAAAKHAEPADAKAPPSPPDDKPGHASASRSR